MTAYPQTEISKYLPDMNTFGMPQWLPDYSTFPAVHDTLYKQLVDRVHALGGIISYNHPFGYDMGPAAQRGRSGRQAPPAVRLDERRAPFGADILEVGYAIRGQVDAAAHIALWDTFSRNGTFLRSSILDDVVGSGDIELLAATLELSACVAADLGDGLRAARLAGAAEEHPGEGRHADCTARRGPARAVPGPDARHHPTRGPGR